MVVRMRRNRSQTAQRRSHHALKVGGLVTCSCGALKQSHRACPSCGMYREHVGIDVAAQAQRMTRRLKRREKELKASGQITAQQEAEAAK